MTVDSSSGSSGSSLDSLDIRWVPPDEPGSEEEQIKNKLVASMLSGCMSFCKSWSAKSSPVMVRIVSAESVAFLSAPGMLGAPAVKHVGHRNKCARIVATSCNCKLLCKMCMVQCMGSCPLHVVIVGCCARPRRSGRNRRLKAVALL